MNSKVFDDASQDNYYKLTDVIGSTLKLARNKNGTELQKEAAQKLHDALITAMNNYLSDIVEAEMTESENMYTAQQLG